MISSKKNPIFMRQKCQLLESFNWRPQLKYHFMSILNPLITKGQQANQRTSTWLLNGEEGRNYTTQKSQKYLVVTDQFIKK